MELIIIIVFLLIGLLLIIKGGDWFVDSSVWIAAKTGIPQIIIGATIVSIGTTLPEFLVTITAAISGVQNPELVTSYNEIAVNNAIGSMICNIGLILGIVYSFATIETKGRSFTEKAVFLLAISAILIVFTLTGDGISLLEGAILFLLFIVFIALNIIDAKKQIKEDTKKDTKVDTKKDTKLETKSENGNGNQDSENESSVKMIALFFIGAAAIALGANFLVESAVDLAGLLGIPAQIIGVTVVAVGTSLPELVTGITSLKKGNAHLSVGNVIGANVINATLLLGSAALITRSGMPIDPITKSLTIWAMLLVTVIILVPSLINKKTAKWQGILSILVYFSFIAINVYIVLNAV